MLLLTCIGAALGGAGLSACSTGTSGTGPGLDASTKDAAPDTGVDAGADAQADTGTPLDASDEGDAFEASTCNASNCGGACCGDRCVPRTCAGCSSGTLLCPFMLGVAGGVGGTCVSDCASCLAGGVKAGIACFSCAGRAPTGECAASPVSCPTAADAGACACDPGDAGSCPGTMQVCGPEGACLACGQPGTDGLPCGNGHGCHAAELTCNQ